MKKAPDIGEPISEGVLGVLFGVLKNELSRGQESKKARPVSIIEAFC